jgi:hypothetical protein
VRIVPLDRQPTVIDYGRDPHWTDSMDRVAAVKTLVAWAKGETPCIECGRTIESGAFAGPCPATVSGYHRTEDPDV